MNCNLQEINEIIENLIVLFNIDYARWIINLNYVVRRQCMFPHSSKFFTEITGQTDGAIIAFEQTCVMLCVISLNLSQYNRVLLVPLFYDLRKIALAHRCYSIVSIFVAT